MNNAKHTPPSDGFADPRYAQVKRLRAANINGTARHWTLVSEASGGCIADGLYQRDADEIVRCVNAHDGLVAALRHIAEGGEVQGSYREFARAAIAKATGEA